MNGNLTTIDTTLKSLSNRATALENADTALQNADTAFNTRITKLEAGEFESINAGSITTSKNVTINGNLTVNGTMLGNFDTTLTTQTGIVSALRFSTSVSLVSATSGGSTVTYTYKSNPICNTVTFSGCAAKNSSGSSWGKSQAYLKINGSEMFNTGMVQFSSSNKDPVYRSYSTTLKDGDTIEAYAYTQYSNGSSYVNMSCDGYLVNK